MGSKTEKQAFQIQSERTKVITTSKDVRKTFLEKTCRLQKFTLLTTLVKNGIACGKIKFRDSIVSLYVSGAIYTQAVTSM